MHRNAVVQETGVDHLVDEFKLLAAAREIAHLPFEHRNGAVAAHETGDGTAHVARYVFAQGKHRGVKALTELLYGLFALAVGMHAGDKTANGRNVHESLSNRLRPLLSRVFQSEYGEGKSPFPLVDGDDSSEVRRFSLALHFVLALFGRS